MGDPVGAAADDPSSAKPGNESPPAVVCPFCGSTDTERISLFGSTSLTSQYLCRRCRSAFEQVKWGTRPRP